MTVGQSIRMNSTAASLAQLGYKEDPSKGQSLRFQESLPHLPVPKLHDTAVKYLRSVKAVATPEQYAHTEAAVKEFIKPGGAGEKLQARLEARASDPNTSNWLSDWWNEAAYMAYRDPVVPYVSYFYSYKDDALRKNPATRAAAITTAALTFKDQWDTKTLEPDYMKKLPLCMDLFQYMFNCSRVARPNVDSLDKYPPEGNEFIIVLRKNKFFKVPYQTPEGRRLSTSELELQFLKIYDITKNAAPGPGVGAFTSENRDKAAVFRERLIESPTNAASIKDIEASAFIVCLDEGAPVTNEERAHQYWHGDGLNRYYDKPLQFIVCDNGAAGFQGEHSMMDGTQTHRLNDYVCDVISNGKIEFGTEKSFEHTPQELAFEVNTSIEKDISEAQKDFGAEINAHELSVFQFHGYGKGLIKKFKSSPDAYVQMLLQLAYYRFQGVNRPTYESATTRRFAKGRTETCRSVSLESTNFCKTFDDPSASVADKISAARKAFDAHVKYIADASAGFGVDRHWLGLKKVLQPGEEMPAIFKDPMNAYSATWYLSTSQLSSEFFNGYGWSEVVPEGFGLAYMINENNIQINIVSKKLGTEKMKYYLTEAAQDMAALFSTELNKPKL